MVGSGVPWDAASDSDARCAWGLRERFKEMARARAAAQRAARGAVPGRSRRGSRARLLRIDRADVEAGRAMEPAALRAPARPLRAGRAASRPSRGCRPFRRGPQGSSGGLQRLAVAPALRCDHHRILRPQRDRREIEPSTGGHPRRSGTDRQRLLRPPSPSRSRGRAGRAPPPRAMRRSTIRVRCSIASRNRSTVPPLGRAWSAIRALRRRRRRP